MILRISLLSLLLFLIGYTRADTDYIERLDITPLRTSLLHASFQFWSNASLESYEEQHFRYIPRSLGQILQNLRTRELHLRFSSGRWDDDNWGTRPHYGRKEGGTGVELWAWVEADSDEQSFARWTSLNHALSGLFCASLNFIDSTRTTRPRLIFEREGKESHNTPQNLYLLHGSLPREVVCTENLTPFLKLLPCKGNAGIASLLDGHKLFDASWQSMAIDVRPVCSSKDNAWTIEMEQVVDMVLDTERAKRPRDNPIPRPIGRGGLLCNQSKSYGDDSCYPADLGRGQSWTVAEIFGRPIQGSCLAEDDRGNARNTLCLHVPTERETISPDWSKQVNGTDERCFTLNQTNQFEMVLSHLGPQTFNPHHAPTLYASRSIMGHGQERGVEFVYFESLPWFMKPYLHTLNARLSGSSTPDSTLIRKSFYKPAVDRERGTQLELVMSIPANSTVFLTYEFDKAILRYTEYPPDANRGFDVAPAVIRLLSSPNDDRSAFLRTTSLLLPLPTPDFSMPYNVIILTSTVIALAFGSIFNLLVRRLIGADEEEKFNLHGYRDQIKARLIKIKERFRNVDKAKKDQ